MYNVQFPKLGWEFHVQETAFQIGNAPIAWYGIIIAVGFMLAFLYAMASCKKMRINADKLVNCVLVGMITGIIGARLYYVIFYPGDKYLNNPMEIFNIREGGLGIYGGIIGGLLGGMLTAKLCKLKVPAVLDIASLGFLIGQCIGRWGNFVNQEAFGSQTDLPWGMVSEGTRAVVNGPVHPCFFYESLWCLIGFVLLHIFCRKFRRYDGQVFLLYSVWYGIGRFFIEGLRTDSLLTPIANLRVSQLVAAVAVIAGVILLVVFRNRTTLSGCGSAEVIALNALQEEVPEDLIQADAFSTETEDAAKTDSLEEEITTEPEEDLTPLESFSKESLVNPEPSEESLEKDTEEDKE
ncbi:prolipoprotein diacylglyceryl transferase [Anaeromassilibacillus senegalensis]|uniref:prolipoprotein diacylglyceryl transferase n=1 Tax=Anaeromassilibacillus senegalensis TaxID=1673717 RepID=UPI000680C593|nr:prolipoprotein diacylglyceryl transferase [Anaeromassilibacillus senegalensis]